MLTVTISNIESDLDSLLAAGIAAKLKAADIRVVMDRNSVPAAAAAPEPVVTEPPRPSRRVKPKHTPARAAKRAPVRKPAPAAPIQEEREISQRDAVRIALSQVPQADTDDVLQRAVKFNSSITRNTVTTILGQLKMTHEIEKDEHGFWSATGDMKQPQYLAGA